MNSWNAFALATSENSVSNNQPLPQHLPTTEPCDTSFLGTMNAFLKTIGCLNRQQTGTVAHSMKTVVDASGDGARVTESPRSMILGEPCKDSLKSYRFSAPNSPMSSASEASTFEAQQDLAVLQFPVPCYSAFAAITQPLESDPCDFSGRSLRSILVEIAHQVESGIPQPAVLHAALSELEKLSFRKSYIMSMCYENNAIPLMVRVLELKDTKAACKGAVVLWNISFNHKPSIADIKKYNVMESLASLIAHNDRNARYAASGCLSVLTAASASCRARCVASGALPHLVQCLVEEDDGNVIYHAGGTLYYIAQHPQFVPAIVAAGAVPAFQRLLGSAQQQPNNLKLAKRALQRLGVQ